jgi:hypothetical protein
MGKQNLNKQYIIEGLSAGFLVVVGSMGCILLTVSDKKQLVDEKIHAWLSSKPYPLLVDSVCSAQVLLVLESQQNQCLQRHLGYHLQDRLCRPRVCRVLWPDRNR